jgi:hypothetical protein
MRAISRPTRRPTRPGAGVSIYVVALTGPAPPTRGTPWNVAQERATIRCGRSSGFGRRIFLPAAPTELAAVYGAIARELAVSTTLATSPPSLGTGRSGASPFVSSRRRAASREHGTDTSRLERGRSTVDQ